MIRIVAVSGNKNSGKTMLCRKLLSELSALDIRVGYIKRTTDEVLSEKHTDTGSVSDMGIGAVLWGPDGLRYELPSSERTTPQFISSAYFPDSELIIHEGGKNLALPKIWVSSEGEDTPQYPGIFMIYDRTGKNKDSRLVYCGGEERDMALRLASLVRGKAYRSAKVYLGDSPLPMKDFIADFIRGSIMGMLASLKGGKNQDKAVRIYLDGNMDGKK
ncbi:MAG: molybdopterin-guanine dinucleotide biosynthesis protein MobB [Synergistaceae bacterium]|nr:molybdopterin-guanine dinucleotide biosynthesis protein MobB [Synergistaceae bacterium]